MRYAQPDEEAPDNKLDLPIPILKHDLHAVDAIETLIDAYNELLTYVADMQGQRHDGNDWVWKEPK